jgi:chromosome partitioning protein
LTTIAISNNKGGVGKTTTTINLAAALTKYNKRVLMIDLDSQSSLSVYLGYEADNLMYTTYDLILNKAPIELITQKINDNLSLIPSSIDLQSAEIELLTNSSTKDKNPLESLLKALKRDLDFDYILIDCGPTFGILTLNAMVSSDYVIAPVEPEYLSYRGLEILINTIKTAQKYNSKLELMGILITMFRSTTTQHSEVCEALRKRYKVFDTVIKNSIKFANASMNMKSMIEYMPNDEGSLAYIDLAGEVIRHG